MSGAGIRTFVRSALRTRRTSWALLAIGMGFAAGASVAAIAGGYRTLTAFPHFADESRAADLYIVSDCASPTECRAVVDRVAALPAVAAAGAAHTINAEFRTSDGRAITPNGDPCFSGSGEVALVVAGNDERFGSTLNRLDLRAGRVADPTRANEVLVAGEVVRRAKLAVGDQLTITAGCQDETSPIAKRRLTIVGVEESALEAHGDVGFYLSGVHGTPALMQELLARHARTSAFIAVRLAPDADVHTFETQAAAVAGAGQVVISTSDTMSDIERSVRPEAATLWIIGALLGLAAAVVLGSALARQALAEAPRLRLLRQLGFTMPDVTAAGGLLGAVVALGAVVVALVSAFAFSLATPIGEARRFEPDLGLQIDARVWLAGAVALMAMIVAIITVATRRAASSKSRRARRGSIMERTVASGHLRPAPAAGLRMAFARPSQSTALALRCGLVGLVIGIAGVVAAATFLSGVEHLRATPRLVGLNWDAQVSIPGSDEHAVRVLREGLGAAPSVERLSFASVFSQPRESVVPDQPQTWVMSFTSGPDAVTPTVIRGRAPVAPGEVLLNPRLAARVGVGVGDTLELLKGGEGQPELLPYVVVGLGVVPIGDGRLELGLGLTFEGLTRLDPEAGLDTALVALRPGAGRDDLARELTAAGVDVAALDIASDFAVAPLVNIDLDQVKGAPWALAILLALIAIGVLVHTTIGAARSRRRELAIHRALGFTSVQMYGATATQATALVAAALVVAIPLGFLGGITAFDVYAHSLGVAPESAVSWTSVTLICAVCLACAVVAVLPVAAGLNRIRTASVLRED